MRTRRRAKIPSAWEGVDIGVEDRRMDVAMVVAIARRVG